MYRLRSRRRWICAAALVSLAVVSCGFIDLRLIGFSIEPDTPDAVLSSEYGTVNITFNTEMDRQATEGIIKVTSDSGSVDGDVSWAGNTLIFRPVAPWTAGIRYALNASGMVRAADSRELRIEKVVFFYALNKSPVPQLESFAPSDGASVESVIGDTGNLSGHSPVLELRFSCPMDRFSTETAFSIEGMSNKIFDWSDDDTRLRISPEKNLSPWKSYRWTLADSAKSREGVPLAKSLSARFITDADRLLPRVNGVYPAIFTDDMYWQASGETLENGFGASQGIIIEFNKPMADNASNLIRFDPSLAGRAERISETAFVYIPNRDPQPETSYAIIISADAQDSGGMKMGEEFREHFTADIPYLRIISFNVDGTDAAIDLTNADTAKSGGDLYNGEALAVQADVPGGGALRFTIGFSLPFELEAKQNIPRSISLAPFFPGTLPPIALRFVTWISDRHLRMEWEGLQPGTADELHFYRLAIPGGRGGIDTGNGMYMREDQYIMLEAR